MNRVKFVFTFTNGFLFMTSLRTHTCGQLTLKNVGQEVTLMGWVNTVRDHGGLIFIDLRDHYGLTQIVVNPGTPFFSEAEKVRQESVVQIKGQVIARQGGANANLATGEIEVTAHSFHLEASSEVLPFQVSHNTKNEGEEIRLKYRFLDLRSDRLQKNIIFRSKVIQHIRTYLFDQGFHEFQTPILTSSSPEGARDFLVPSRVHPGKFYALPQAPQIFKQLLMTSGFDKYFQIAPCFRDEDARADRSPGEFYQLDMEMSFVEQEDVFVLVEKLMVDLFQKFSTKKVKNTPFPRIPYREAMDKYGSDKPDLRFDLPMANVENIFTNTQFNVFKNILDSGRGALRALKVPQVAAQSRKFFDDLESFSRDAGLGGLPWLVLKEGDWKGSFAKNVSSEERAALKEQLSLVEGDAVFFVIGNDKIKTLSAGGKIRTQVADKLNLRDNSTWAFCWIIDFPFYEWDEDEKKVGFCHNPFSMPQGGIEALNNKEPLDILAYQYDIVCNGIELSSGAIRNHRRDIMKRAFEIAGYDEAHIEKKFPALWNAFNYGPPPHGGIAPGIDRMVMILLDEPNIREVITFPMNQKGVDLLMNAPSEVPKKSLDEIHITIKAPK